MTHFESFDSLEAVFDRMATAEMEAMERLAPQQRELLSKRRFFWLRPYQEMGITIFGLFDLDAFIAKEKELWDLEDGPFNLHRQRIEHNNQVRGYKTGRAYSVIEPTGELGDTHVANMWEISEQAFAEAKTVGWDIPRRMEECPTLRRELIILLSREG